MYKNLRSEITYFCIPQENMFKVAFRHLFLYKFQGVQKY